MSYYLAIDIGASSGRHMLGHIEDGKIKCKEVHRFANSLVEKDGQLCWDLERLFLEILNGMKKCKEIGEIPVSVGIDTWGIDFVLLDENDKILGNSVSYRDRRTEGCSTKVYKHILEDELYSRTGIQKQEFNTIYQLMAVKNGKEQYLKMAKAMLLIPDYFNFRLCGVKKTEYTNATTTGLVNAEAKCWDNKIISACGYPKEIFAEIVQPCSILGNLTKEIRDAVGYDCTVTMPCTHDTASAVVAIPSIKDVIYISSGTWSLIGTEKGIANCSKDSQVKNFTNEGGIEGRYRHLKNIMGLWMIQELRRELGNKFSFGELCEMAEKSRISSVIDCNSSNFLAPSSMIRELQQSCKETGQQVPKEAGELAAVVYNSLSACYRDAVAEIELLTNTRYDSVHIIGGGANAEYLTG